MTIIIYIDNYDKILPCHDRLGLFLKGGFSTVLRTSCQIPHQPGVHGTKTTPTLHDGFTYIGTVLDQPSKFHCTEVSGEGQTANLLERMFTFGFCFLGEPCHDVGGATIQPNDCVV